MCEPLSQPFVQLWHIRPVCERVANELRYRADERDPAYVWLFEQLQCRGVVRSEEQVRFAWYAYRGQARIRPDLRESGHLPRGTEGFLELWEVPVASTLIMQFEMWVHIMNGWFVAESHEEMAWFERQPHVQRDSLVRRNWPRVFERDWGDPEYWGQSADRALQACVCSDHVACRGRTRFRAK
jgi:hypothetical protein